EDVELDIKALKEKVKRLEARIKSKESKVERMKSNLKNAMLVFGKEKLDLNFYKISLRPSEALSTPENIDFANIPSEFIRIKPEVKEVNKSDLKKALKNGLKLQGFGII